MRIPASALSGCLLFLITHGTVGAATGDIIYARPGQLVSANGTRLNLYCMGKGSPAVVFDAGHQDWAPAWAVVQPEVAKWTRACSYDRAGSGFSDVGPMPRSAVRIADELHSALHNARIAGPYILVGHAFGGVNMRVFADRFMTEVAGLVLLDTDAVDVDSAEGVAATHKVFAVQGAELRACRDALAARKPLSSAPPPAAQPDLTCEQRFFRGFPERAWSPELNARLLKDAQTKLPLYDEVISELQEMPGDEAYLRQNQKSFGVRPIRVLTAVNRYSDDEKTPTAVHLRHLKREAETIEAQARFATLSSNGTQILAYHSKAAYIQFDEPDLVDGAIRQVYDQSK
jgi:pimeloyl-ACP methyl ester carboxylesterase